VADGDGPVTGTSQAAPDFRERVPQHREAAAAAGFRAVQSTPLIDAAGTLLGVLSTHYPEPHQMQDADRLIIRHDGELAGQIMTQRNARQDGLG
jgi:GAF domain-containing protein